MVSPMNGNPAVSGERPGAVPVPAPERRRAPDLPLPPLSEQYHTARRQLIEGRACTVEPCYDMECWARYSTTMCHWQNAWRLRNDLRAARIPELYWDATFENALESFRSDPNSHFQDAQDYVANYEEHLRKGTNVVMKGDVGKGKTYLAMCMANALIEKRVDVFAVAAPRIGQILHNCRERHDGSLDRFRQRLYRTKVLFVDEWMTQYNDTWVAVEFQSIFRERTDRRRPTVVTTNLTKDDILRRTAEHPDFKTVVDRLFDGLIWDLMPSQDYRTTKKKLTGSRAPVSGPPPKP